MDNSKLAAEFLKGSVCLTKADFEQARDLRCWVGADGVAIPISEMDSFRLESCLLIIKRNDRFRYAPILREELELRKKDKGRGPDYF